MPVSWAEVRDRHIETVGADVVARRASQVLARSRAKALANVRRRTGLRQKDVAHVMGVSVASVSGIEHGELSDVDTLGNHVHALGGELKMVATFGDKQFRVG